MKPTVEQVKAAFAGHEPCRGGYGSEFSFFEHEIGVEVELEAEWKPRHVTPSILVTGLSEGLWVTYLYDDEDENPKTEAVEQVARGLADTD